eukprot:578826-Prymnesium_polylepis.1
MEIAKPEFKARMAVKLAVAGAFHTDYMKPVRPLAPAASAARGRARAAAVRERAVRPPAREPCGPPRAVGDRQLARVAGAPTCRASPVS